MTTDSVSLENLTFNSQEEVDKWCHNTFIGISKIVASDYKNKTIDRISQVSHIPSLAIFEELYIAAKSAYKQLGITDATPRKYTLDDLEEKSFLPIDAIAKRERELRDNPPKPIPTMGETIKEYAGNFFRSINVIPSYSR